MAKELLIPDSYPERLDLIINEAWRLFASSFHYERFPVSKEAPFQFQFAKLLQQIGQAYSIKPNELFFVDLETKEEGIRGKSKYVDITCGFKDCFTCAIELKFKTAKQGAQDHGRIDAYLDIEALEILETKNRYNTGYFFMITDSKTYINRSTKGVGTIFPIHQGYKSPTNAELTSNSKGRDDVVIRLSQPYNFNWYQIQDWYFLMLKTGESK